MTIKVGKKDALIVVDYQKDFCPGGALPVEGGDEIAPVLNAYIDIFRGKGGPIFATRDWHPPDHISFKEQGGQWPPHCVRDTEGAEFHPDLDLHEDMEIISKATQSEKEAYSGFDGTDLKQKMEEKEVKRVFVGGLATDYCVKNTVLDSLEAGFDTYLLKDATRGVNVEPGDSEKAVKSMREAGATVTSMDRLA